MQKRIVDQKPGYDAARQLPGNGQSGGGDHDLSRGGLTVQGSHRGARPAHPDGRGLRVVAEFLRDPSGASRAPYPSRAAAMARRIWLVRSTSLRCSADANNASA